MTFKASDIPNLSGKVALVTGGNGGLGEISCRELSAHGAKVFMASRSESKARDAIERIKKAHPDADVSFIELDLTELASVKRAADQFNAASDRLDILLNNAGVMATPYEFTKDGLELQMGTNVVAHYLLTMLLLPKLVKTSQLPEYQQGDATVRVVQVSSMGHTMTRSRPDFTSLEGINKQYAPEVRGTWTRYANSKLGNILIADELKRMLPESARISSLSLHPGVVNTGLLRGANQSYGSLLGSFFNLSSRLFFTHPDQGALTQLYACTSPEVDGKKLSGSYFVPTAKLGSKSSIARDDDGSLAAELFRFCRGFVKDKAGIDVDQVLAEVDLKTPESHL
ncbi:uncharacterized protein PFL1_05146 [Pseudozyma flocculosa PF-1]|uniref:Related to Oxidoreductase, short-chain dehydrogenase n=2 Tax=Pseudozyma flocculosa TaxID=84751 RepID=A0A5C3F853_9BASI|nr:uncharacterized protein PFL1_05146 [Pseudozyma flocculosa PF-1]EPQ27223.1 hypothetical protein PFL1_05146 [Pseudozyma flocculosa PF-1]SPO39589.1 related to Oxidoreductase, short-chain dehydrogenase [Pseudozyma flocculosa]